MASAWSSIYTAAPMRPTCPGLAVPSPRRRTSRREPPAGGFNPSDLRPVLRPSLESPPIHRHPAPATRLLSGILSHDPATSLPKDRRDSTHSKHQSGQHRNTQGKHGEIASPAFLDIGRGHAI